MSYFAAILVAWFTNAVDTGRTQELIRQLDDPRFETRQYADESLRLAGLRIVPVLREELGKGPPLELARRLQGIIDHYVRPDWHQRLEEALAEAKRTGKPILVVATPPAGDDPDKWAPPEVSDPQLAHFLKQHYVVVWQVSQMNLRLIQNNNNNNDFAALNIGNAAPFHAYLCDADGKVLQQQSGMPALDLLAEKNGTPRTLQPDLRPVAVANQEEVLDRVTPNGGVQIVGRSKIQVQEQQLRNVRWRRYGAPANPIGMAIQDVLGQGDLLLYSR